MALLYKSIYVSKEVVAKRAELIRDFYEVGLQGKETKFTYPTVVPSVMASMQELTGTSITVAEVNMRIQRLLLEWNAQTCAIIITRIRAYVICTLFRKNL